MITLKLATGHTATVNDGVWTVEGNDELTRVLNSPEMQPPPMTPYAPTDDARKAMHVLNLWGGQWVSTDEKAEPGLVY